jgi:hypothetical protein
VVEWPELPNRLASTNQNSADASLSGEFEKCTSGVMRFEPHYFRAEMAGENQIVDKRTGFRLPNSTTLRDVNGVQLPATFSRC